MNLDPVLIYKDQSAINSEKAVVTKTAPYLQQFYNAFKAIEIPVTLEEMKTIFWHVTSHQHNATSQITDFVRQKLIAKMGNPDFNGVPVNVEALIKMPDLTAVILKAEGYGQVADYGTYYNPDYYQLVGDLISIHPDAFTTIESKFTYYSKNDKGAEVAARLFELSTQLNYYITFLIEEGGTGTHMYSSTNLNKVWTVQVIK